MNELDNVKFVARQAILDSNENVFGYELLYRNSEDNFFPADVSDDDATVKLFFDSILFFGLAKLVNNKNAFINLSTNTLLTELPTLISSENVVYEIIERTSQLSSILHTVDRLQKNGYVFALDDYDGDEKWDALLEKVKYIKLELNKNPQITVDKIYRLKLKFPHAKIIIERIEDHENFDQMRAAGADYFQGYYFTKPQLINFKNIDSSKLVALELLKIVMTTPLNFDLLISKIKNDAGLVSRILKLSNAACKTSNREISAISQAVIYLGENAIKRFVTVLTLGGLGDNKPSELLKLGLVRAQFISLLLKNKTDEMKEKGFLLGLVSILSALLNADKKVVYNELPLTQDILAALENNEGTIGLLLSLCTKFERNMAFGKGTMHDIENVKNQLGVSNLYIIKSYAESLFYADDTLDCIC